MDFLVLCRNYPLNKAWESNPLRFTHFQNAFGIFNGGYPQKWLRGAAPSQNVDTYGLGTRADSGKILWLERRRCPGQGTQGEPGGQARDSQGHYGDQTAVPGRRYAPVTRVHHLPTPPRYVHPTRPCTPPRIAPPTSIKVSPRLKVPVSGRGPKDRLILEPG